MLNFRDFAQTLFQIVAIVGGNHGAEFLDVRIITLLCLGCLMLVCQ